AADVARLDRADEAVDAVLADQGGAVAVLEPGELGYQVLLAAPTLAVRWIRRLRLARLVSVQERENRPLLLGEAAGQTIGLLHHARALGGGGGRGERSGAHRTETVHLVDDHQPDGAPLQAERSALDRQLRLQAGDKCGFFGHDEAPGASAPSRG